MTRLRSARDVWALVRRSEAIIVDLRPPERFCHGHPTGAISVPYSERGLAERVEIAAPGALPVALLASDPAQAESAARQLLAAGRTCLGSVEHDPSAWQAANAPWETLLELPVAAVVNGDIAASRVVLDVREPLEWETGYVPGALLIPLGQVRAQIERLPREHEIAIICEAGVRSATAASILRASGFARVANIPEGTAGYRKMGWPLAFPDEEEQEPR